MASSSTPELSEVMESLKLEDTTKRIFSEEIDRVDQESEDEHMLAGTDTINLDSNIWATIPEELLEKVFARLPFKCLFQTRVLSRSWEAKLCSNSFQSEVSQVASRWDSYCPVYISHEGSIGYNAASKRCERVLTLSYLPYHQAPLIPNSRGKVSVCGSLLCFMDLHQFPSIYVTNVITKTWKVLPPRPNMNYPAIIQLHFVGFDAYRVLLITPLATPCAQIYDSATSSWSIRFSESAPEASTQLASANSRWVSSNRDRDSANNAWTDSTYFENTLYVLWGYHYDGPCELLAYKVKQESWSNIQIRALRPRLEQSDLVYFIPMSRILVCVDRVMIVVRLTVSSSGIVSSWPPTGKNDLLVVFQLFPDTEEIVEVSRGPPMELGRTDLNEAACDDNCIYFYQRLAPKSTVVVYNTQQQKWSCLPSIFCTQNFHDALKKRTAPQFFLQPATSSFQPGFNPFIAV